MDKTLFLDYEVKPISFEVINPEFTKMRCWIMALGKNRNYSYFTKESVEAALPSLYNIPVVAHIKKRSDGGWYVGSHDRQIIIDDDGIAVNDLTLPFGLVPESSSIAFEEVIESDGTRVTYLVADILLWTGRYPDIIEAKSQTDEQAYFNQSMEISVSAWQELNEDKKYSDITQFNFSALCLLGRDLENPEYHSEPCFPSARVEPYQYSFGDKFKSELSLMIKELNKFDFSKDNYSNKEKEEEKILNKEQIDAMFTKYNLKIEDIDFSIDGLETIEALETKLQEVAKKDFSLTANQFAEELSNQLRVEKFKDRWGDEYYRYSFYDYKDTEVYAFDRSEDYKLVGFMFSVNGDSIEINFESKKRKKIEVVDFNEGTLDDGNPMFSIIQESIEFGKNDGMKELEQKYSDYETIKSDFDAYKETYKTSENDVEELRKFKAEIVAEKRKQDEEAIFSMEVFKNIVDSEDFKALKEKAGDYDLDALTEKCFSILGKSTVNFAVNTPVKKETVKINIDVVNSEADDPYGGLFAMYSNKNK